ncbi:hypothetical protein INT44_002736 [Umbelopsis vinacea]|uniref:Uncharacterized protein n=1 Tax=Umbelopsis vinacea TaxID=44442 RepID=A0A8H7Q7F6_9FUNG|nr:hypothetical protein INT44_002736 [Umbelopsis vinacea]
MKAVAPHERIQCVLAKRRITPPSVYALAAVTAEGGGAIPTFHKGLRRPDDKHDSRSTIKASGADQLQEAN